MEETIVGISTALGAGAINIIRVSGDDSINIVNKIFKGKNLEKVLSHTINYGYIIDNDKKVDQVLVTIMKAPRTYTKEDVVEINCHGGIATTNQIMELLLINGCRIAEPGEFTKRAFLNGRIDLIEAEGVMDLINAKTKKAMNLAINQVDGHVSGLIKSLRKDILNILANIEVNIDYPEYEDILELTFEHLKPSLDQMRKEIKKIINESENGKIIKEGIKTAIIGRPNVGKSSLLNTLLDEEKAIVTDIEGTTRDIVEGQLNVDGVLLNIIDTAGIRETQDKVEKIGVDKSLELIDNAELILFVLANSQEINNDEVKILEKLEQLQKNYIILINKSDLETKINKELIENEKSIKISATEKSNIDNLKTSIKKMFNLEVFEDRDLTYLTSARSISLLKEIYELTNDIEIAIENKTPIDMIEIDLKAIWEKLGEIIGETYQDELIDQLFANFCLGK